MSHPIAWRAASSLAGVALCALLVTACPTVDLGGAPVSPGACRPDPAYVEAVIWPDFITGAASCVGAAGCHRLEDGRSALRLDTADPLDLGRNYAVVTRFLSCGTPSASSLLTKPLAGV